MYNLDLANPASPATPAPEERSELREIPAESLSLVAGGAFPFIQTAAISASTDFIGGAGLGVA